MTGEERFEIDYSYLDKDGVRQPIRYSIVAEGTKENMNARVYRINGWYVDHLVEVRNRSQEVAQYLIMRAIRRSVNWVIKGGTYGCIARKAKTQS